MTSSIATTAPTATSAATARALVKTYGHGETAVRALDEVTTNFPVGSRSSSEVPTTSRKERL